MGAGSRIVLFVIVLVAGFVYAARLVTDLRGTKTGATAGLTVDYGEEIFWGKGTCATCHKVGDRGSNKRCPDQENLGARAAERAAERTTQTGKPYTAADYLVESIATPSAYVVEGFPDGLMPLVYAPPVDLSVNEILAVLLYLQSLGGTPDLEALQESMRRFAGVMSRPPDVVPLDQRILGDPDRGRAVFLSDTAACSRCHAIQGLAGADGKVGPDLSPIGLRDLTYLFESIVDPAAVIVPGFEGILVDVKGGTQITGVLRAETEDALEIALQDVAPLADRFEVVPEENLVRVPKAAITRASLVTGAAEDGHTHVVLVPPGLEDLASVKGRTGPGYTAEGKRHRHRIRGGQITEEAGHTHTLSRDTYRLGLPQGPSIMPDNLPDLLTVRQFRDLLAFLLTCRGTPAAGAAAGTGGSPRSDAAPAPGGSPGGTKGGGS